MMILGHIRKLSAIKQKMFAVLIDPDKVAQLGNGYLEQLCNKALVDFFMVGGSLLTQRQLENTLHILKQNTHAPLVIFPGNAQHISTKADALLFLNLISGRNPEYLIGQQVQAAPTLKQMEIEVISTGYMLIDQRNLSTTAYVSQTQPIPHLHPEVAAHTAYAGQLMGNQLIFLDAGSGAKYAVSSNMIAQVKAYIDVPLIVGGGIKNGKMAIEASKSGADVVVVGNSLETQPEQLCDIAEAVKSV